ncbi:MAG: GvpL/GvpF family gas vesicle protein [Synechococcales cyanobacterium C42_A2020_086]|jgi:hypothetical protein|nr:GvpL/GvpF family gas vesicle protein [Synechococcales cyanobacterium C42_A2020_086]
MYTYAFLLHSSVALDLPKGISGALELVSVADVAALVEPDLPFEGLQQSDQQLMQAVLAHDRVIRELFQQVTVLPLRFGTCFVSRQGLIDHLEAHWRNYREKLTQLQGKAEYSLKLLPRPFPETMITTEVKGKDYFLAKKKLYQDQLSWQQHQQAELPKILDVIAQRYSQWQRGEPSDGIERIYLLTEHPSDRSLEEDCQDWQQQCAYWDLKLGEPLPPYHFV